MWRCPRCFKAKSTSHGRTCDRCNYRGDWIQPGHYHLYKCPAYCEASFLEAAKHPECKCGDLADLYSTVRL